MTDIPTSEPREIVIGETLRWSKSLADHPASEWALTYYVRGAGKGFDAVAAADGDDFLVTVPAATTALMSAGAYYYQAWAVKDGEKFVVAEGQVLAVAGLATVDDDTVVDNRSRVKKILDAIDALMEGKASRDQQEYSIGTGTSTRSLRRLSPVELLAARKEYARLYAQERRRDRVKRGGTLFKSVKVRFDEPS